MSRAHLVKRIGHCDGSGIEPTKIAIASRKVSENPSKWAYECPECGRWIGTNRHDALATHNRSRYRKIV